MRKGLPSFFIFCCAFSLTSDASVWAAGGTTEKPKTQPQTQSQSLKVAAPTASKTGLHRLDFRLDHASCPSCILKVRKALRATPGIVKCEIALRKPYGGVVIFEPAKLKTEKMQEVAREADPNKSVEMVDFLDKPIDNVPTLLLPKYNGLSKGTT